MKKIIITLVGLLIIALLPLASAVTLDSGTAIEPSASNTTYTMGNDLSFSNVVISNVTPYFNDSIFQIEPDSGVAGVVINSLTSFVVTATDDVVFTLGGFSANEDYDIVVDDTVWSVVTANATGVLSFTYTSWSEHMFSIVLHTDLVGNGGGGGGGDRPTAPEPFEIPPSERADNTLVWIVLAIAIAIIILVIILAVERRKDT